MASLLLKNHLFREFQALQNAVNEWHSSDEPRVFVSPGVTIKAISNKLSTAFEKFFDNTADDGMKIDDGAKLAILRIDDLSNAYDTFKRQAVEENPNTPPGGTNELWRAFHSLVDIFQKEQDLPKPMPIKMLVDQNVPHMQIAAIYGWKDASGAFDATKVIEEIAEPGKHYNPDTWVHPAMASRMAAIDEEFSKRPATRKKVYDYEAVKSAPSKTAPSLAEMVQIGAPPAQIARLHGITEAEALELLREAGTEEKRDISTSPASPTAGFAEFSKSGSLSEV